jgi:hypothetical protein
LGPETYEANRQCQLNTYVRQQVDATQNAALANYLRERRVRLDVKPRHSSFSTGGNFEHANGEP